VIQQTLTEVLVEDEGQTLVYKFDGSELDSPDQSLGEIPGFVRKIKTTARWEGL